MRSFVFHVLIGSAVAGSVDQSGEEDVASMMHHTHAIKKLSSGMTISEEGEFEAVGDVYDLVEDQCNPKESFLRCRGNKCWCQQCPPVTRQWCPAGRKVNPTTGCVGGCCKQRMCKKECPYGYESKPNGCSSCKCKPKPPSECPDYYVGTPRQDTVDEAPPLDKDAYYEYLERLDIPALYNAIVKVMKKSNDCWPADGPQDGDEENYAGLFGRLAWHCSGSYRHDDAGPVGGCEGGNLRHWPEREWRDNGNLDQARALLAEVKLDFPDLSWGDLMAFAGTVGIKASGGPANKFCFGRVDNEDGRDSIMLGSEGTDTCDLGEDCVSHVECPTHYQWAEQDPSDHVLCNFTQPDGRKQGSHSVGLIYVYPEGPQLKADQPDYDASAVHQRSRSLSAKEVRDTFGRMGWNDQETVALIGGGHTLGRAHGNCPSKPSPDTPCTGKFTTTSGFEGAWTKTPSKWSYDYFDGMFGEDSEWIASKSPEGNDQWAGTGTWEGTMRLTADLALVTDETYRKYAQEYYADHAKFDNDFAAAWYKLVHRSAAHPQPDDLEADAGKCTNFDFTDEHIMPTSPQRWR